MNESYCTQIEFAAFSSEGEPGVIEFRVGAKDCPVPVYRTGDDALFTASLSRVAALQRVVLAVLVALFF